MILCVVVIWTDRQFAQYCAVRYGPVVSLCNVIL